MISKHNDKAKKSRQIATTSRKRNPHSPKSPRKRNPHDSLNAERTAAKTYTDTRRWGDRNFYIRGLRNTPPAKPPTIYRVYSFSTDATSSKRITRLDKGQLLLLDFFLQTSSLLLLKTTDMVVPANYDENASSNFFRPSAPTPPPLSSTKPPHSPTLSSTKPPHSPTLSLLTLSMIRANCSELIDSVSPCSPAVARATSLGVILAGGLPVRSSLFSARSATAFLRKCPRGSPHISNGET